MKFRTASRGTGAAAGLLALTFYFYFAMRGDDGLARATSISVAVLLITAYGAWDFRGLRSFWYIFIALVTAHLLFIALVPWSNARLPGAVIMPFGILDFAASYACVYLALKKYVI